MLGGTLHNYRRFSVVCIVSPLFSFPELYRVRGGYVPNWPPRNDEAKPVFKFVGEFSHLRPPTERRDTLKISAAQRVLVRRTLEGPSYTPGYAGERDRALVRIEPYTRPLPANAAVLAVFRDDDPLFDFWRGVVVAGAEDGEGRVDILVKTPSWRVVLFPLEPMRRGLIRSLDLTSQIALAAAAGASIHNIRGAVGTARRVL